MQESLDGQKLQAVIKKKKHLNLFYSFDETKKTLFVVSLKFFFWLILIGLELL